MGAESLLTAAWRAIELNEGSCVRLSGADCTVWARRFRDEWMIASQYDSEQSPTDLARAEVFEWPEELEWTRYVTVDNDALEIVPALPDRAVVVRPMSPVTILPGRWARFYFTVPLWIRFVSHPPGKVETMCEIPSVALSSTWFGTPTAGDRCYALDSRLERSAVNLEMGLRAVCSLVVRNTAREDLKFQRISIHVEHLRLFASQNRFWANEITVAFRGASEISNVSYAAAPAGEAAGAAQVAGPRVPFDRNLLKRSFSLFREITGI